MSSRVKYIHFLCLSYHSLSVLTSGTCTPSTQFIIIVIIIIIIITIIIII